MTAGTAEVGPRRTEDTRTRLLDTALRLFGEHGVEGTSLQMIADALGVTKAAVYYHFKTKHEIVAAVAEPALRELTAVVDAAEAQRRHGPRVDTLLEGLADIVVRYRTMIALFISDPAFGSALGGALQEVEVIKQRLSAIALEGADSPHAVIRTHFVFAGLMLSGAGDGLGAYDVETVRAALLDAARQIMGRPRRRTSRACRTS